MSVINTNLSSLVAQKNLTTSRADLGRSFERLSSGLRINSAKDDAAGQAISNRMTAQLRGMAQAQRNANDGISLAQTKEGALNEINSNLQRVRELAVQAANDTNTADDRASIQTEIDERVLEIDRLANGTTFNGQVLLNGAATDMDIQVGAGTTADDEITLTAFDATSATLGVGALAVTDNATAQTSITAVDAAMKLIDEERAVIGATMNRFDSVLQNLQSGQVNLSAARSRIQDADYAVEAANMTRAQILQQAGTSVLGQANQSSQSVLSLLG